MASNDDILKAILELDKRMDVHIEHCKAQCKVTSDLAKTVWGNGSIGLRREVDNNSRQLSIIRWLVGLIVPAILAIAVAVVKQALQ